MSRIRTLCLAGVLLTGCAGTVPDSPVRERLDESTGATLTYLGAPLRYFSEDSTLAANERDYLDAGPVEVNQSGSRSYWLWIGVWSTIDRGVQDGEAARPPLERLQVMADGQPMDLDWAAAAASVAGIRQPPYAAPVPAEPSVFIPVTKDQLLHLGKARQVSVQTRSADGAWREWQPWAPAGDALREFAARVRSNPGVAATTMTDE